MISCPYCNHQFEESGFNASKCPQCKRQLQSQTSGTRTLNVSDQQEKSNITSTISPADQPDSTPDTKFDRGLQNTIHAGSETVQQGGHAGPRPPADSNPVFPMSSPGQIRKLVQSIAGPSARPGMTIKQNDRQKVQVDALVLQRRSITSQQKADADESDYQIVKSIGEGGMGTVFAALQTSVCRDVAVKTLKPKLASDQFDRKKFLKEACITAGLDHPNIVPVYDLGISDDGTLFYSMKLIRGKSWVEVFDKKSRVENLDILIRVCDALAFAHSRRIIHRDIKPENVMIGAFGEVLVTDWGLALDMNQSTEFSFGGSPAYMAPEMASHDATKIGIASDIYLLGASLFEIVTGYPPHPGRTATECVLAASENVILQYEKSDNLLDVALQAMATDIKDRFQSVAEFQAAIRQYQSQLESIAFTSRGEDLLEQATRESDYEAFSKAIFSFQDAVELWPENTRASVNEKKARLAYGMLALENENFDLGLSLVDQKDPDEAELFNKLKQGARHQRSRERLLKIARTSAIVMGLAALAIAFGGWAITNKERIELAQTKSELETKNVVLGEKEKVLTKTNEDLKRSQTDLATKNLALEEKEKVLTKTNEDLKRSQTDLATQNLALEEKEKILTKTNENLKRSEGDLAEKNLALEENEKILTKTNENLERSKEGLAEALGLAKSRLIASRMGRYQSDIRYADSVIKQNRIPLGYQQLERVRKFDLLDENHRGWELHRLYQLCHESKDDLLPLADHQTVSFLESSSDGTIQVAVLSDGTVYARQNGTGDNATKFQRVENLQLDTEASGGQRRVSSLAVADNGDFAVGYLPISKDSSVSGSPSYLEIRNLDKGILKASTLAHSRGVRFVGFRGNRLVTVGDGDDLSEANNTANYRYIKLWNSEGSGIVEDRKALFSNPWTKSDVWAFSRAANQFFYMRQIGTGKFEVQMLSLDGSDWPGKRMKTTPLYQEVSEAKLPVDVDITCVAIVPRPLEDGSYACICGLYDGSLMLISQTGKILNRQLSDVAHSGPVTELQWLGDKLISTGADRNAQVWNWDQEESVLTRASKLAGHRQEIVGVVPNPDQSIVTIADQRLIRQWPVRGVSDEAQLWTEEREGMDDDKKHPVGSFTGLPDHSFAALIGQPRGDVNYSSTTGTSVTSIFPEHLKVKTNIVCAYDSDNHTLIAASGQGSTSFWSVVDGTLRTTQKNHSSELPVLDFNASTRQMVTYGSNGNLAAVWNVDTKQLLHEFENRRFRGASQSIFDCRLSNDGRFLAMSGGIRRDQPTINVVDLATKKTIGHHDSERKIVSSMIFDKSNEKSLIVAFKSAKRTVQGSETVQVIDVRGMEPDANGELIATEATNRNVVVAPTDHIDAGKPVELIFAGYADDKLVSIVREDDKDAAQARASVLVWDGPVWQPGAKPSKVIHLLAVHPNSKFVLFDTTLTYLNPDGRPFLVDVGGDAGEQEIEGASEAIETDLEFHQKTKKDVLRQCTLLPNGQLLLAGRNYAWVLQQTEGKPWQVVFRILPQPACNNVALSNDGQIGISRHVDGRVRLFKIAATGSAETEPEVVNLDGFHDLASLSPDGKRIAVYDDVRGLRMLDFARSFAEKKAVLAESQLNSIGPVQLTALAWSPDSKLIAGAAPDGDLHLWDADSAEPAVNPKTGLGPNQITKISVSGASPDGQRVIAIIDSAKQLRILATSGGKAAQQTWTACPQLSEFPETAVSAQLNPDYSTNGFRLAVGLSNSRVQIWLVEIMENGFAKETATAENQLYRVFDFSVDQRDRDVIFLGFDHTGRELATLTNQEMQVWLTAGWDKAKPVVDTPTTESPTEE